MPFDHGKAWSNRGCSLCRTRCPNTSKKAPLNRISLLYLTQQTLADVEQNIASNSEIEAFVVAPFDPSAAVLEEAEELLQPASAQESETPAPTSENRNERKITGASTSCVCPKSINPSRLESLRFILGSRIRIGGLSQSIRRCQ